MQKTRFTESLIAAAIKKQESGIAVKEKCWELGIHQATFYNWKASMEVTQKNILEQPCLHNAPEKIFFVD